MSTKYSKLGSATSQSPTKLEWFWIVLSILLVFAWTAGNVEFVSRWVPSQVGNIASWFGWLGSWIPSSVSNYSSNAMALLAGGVIQLPAAFLCGVVFLFFRLRGESEIENLGKSPSLLKSLLIGFLNIPIIILFGFWIPFVVLIPAVFIGGFVVPMLFDYGLMNGVEYWAFIGATITTLSAGILVFIGEKDIQKGQMAADMPDV